MTIMFGGGFHRPDRFQIILEKRIYLPGEIIRVSSATKVVWA